MDIISIEELIARGEAKMKAAQIEQEQRAFERARVDEEARVSRVAQFLSETRQAVDPALHPYLMLPEPVDEFDPDNDGRAVFSVPDCTDITVRFFKNWNMDHYKPADDPLIYKVARPKWDDFEGLTWDSIHFHDLSVALVTARAYGRDLTWMIQRQEVREAEAVRRELEEEERREQQEIDDRAHRQAQDRERQDLLDLLTNDLVAFHLLRAFAGIQAEREAWQDKLESANQAMEEIDACHARRVEELEKRAQDMKRDAEDSRARETEARDDADRAEKKLKQASGTSQGQAQRGW